MATFESRAEGGTVSAARRLELEQSLRIFGVPLHLHEGLIGHVVNGVPTGAFLTACLRNDFVDAMCHAGRDLSAEDLRAVAKWIYNEAPGGSWGSPGIVKTWRGE